MSDRLDFVTGAQVLVHRVLARHRPYEFCDECPAVKCRHCGDWGPVGADHSCSCPYRDEECRDHPAGGAS